MTFHLKFIMWLPLTSSKHQIVVMFNKLVIFIQKSLWSEFVRSLKDFMIVGDLVEIWKDSGSCWDQIFPI